MPKWPAELGGTDWSLEQHAVFAREMTLANAPIVSPNSTRMVGPVVIKFGTEEQQNVDFESFQGAALLDFSLEGDDSMFDDWLEIGQSTSQILRAEI